MKTKIAKWYPAACGIHEYRRPRKSCALCKTFMADLKSEKPRPPKSVPRNRNAPNTESKNYNRILHVAYITSAKNREKS